MNKRDRMIVAGLAAKWEWTLGGDNGPQAHTRAMCSKDLLEALNISDRDIAFARAWEIADRVGIQNDDDMFDVLSDMVDENYSAVVDLIDDQGFTGLRHEIENRLQA